MTANQLILSWQQRLPVATLKRWMLPIGAVFFLTVLAGCGSASQNSASSTNSSANGNSTSSSSAASGSTSGVVTADVSNKTAQLNLVANSDNNLNGFNFNGAGKGAMTITVPTGWKVSVSFSNASSSLPHSATVVPYDQREASGLSETSVAFPGATTPSPAKGIVKGTTQTFAFTADKAGKYAIVCAVPGHNAAGMWDTLVVSDSATTASVAAQ